MITQLKAQGPSRTCNESTEEEEGRATSDDGDENPSLSLPSSLVFLQLIAIIITGGRRETSDDGDENVEEEELEAEVPHRPQQHRPL